MEYLDRYEQLLERRGIHSIRFGNILLREYNQIIIPLGPILVDASREAIDIHSVFKKLNGKLVWWSYLDETTLQPEWYAVIKKQHFEIEDYPSSNVRNQIRKGIKNCLIKRIPICDLAEKGYAVYDAAVIEHLHKRIKSISDYKNEIVQLEDFQDIIHAWGIYYDEILIGYSLVYTYGNIEANISEIRINPDYNTQYPSYALFHMLSEEYLSKQGFKYMSDGYRNLMHKTQIQDFLIKKFGFIKAGLTLQLAFRFPWNIVVPCLHPFRSLVKSDSVSAVFQLLSIYKNQKRLPK
jgi:hypothetical protein